MEEPEVTLFRHYVLSGQWNEAEACLPSLGVFGPDSMRVSDACATVYL